MSNSSICGVKQQYLWRQTTLFVTSNNNISDVKQEYLWRQTRAFATSNKSICDVKQQYLKSVAKKQLTWGTNKVGGRHRHVDGLRVWRRWKPCIDVRGRYPDGGKLSKQKRPPVNRAEFQYFAAANTDSRKNKVDSVSLEAHNTDKAPQLVSYCSLLHKLEQWFLTWVWSNPQGSTEPFQGFDEGHLKLVTHFYFLLYWAKMGFDKILENKC